MLLRHRADPRYGYHYRGRTYTRIRIHQDPPLRDRAEMGLRDRLSRDTSGSLRSVLRASRIPDSMSDRLRICLFVKLN